MKILHRVRSLFQGTPESAPGTEAGTRTLLVSGFGWSGSGALIDYAADHAGVGGFRRRFEEGSTLKGLYSLAVFYRSVVAGKTRTAADIASLAEALAGTPGLSERIQPAREFVNIKRNEQMRRELGEQRVDAAVSELVRRLTAKVESKTGEYRGMPADVLAAGTGFIDSLKRASLEVRFKEAPRHLVLNNDPPAYSVDLFKFHPGARYTVVSRDLTDVFATLVDLKRIEPDEKSVRNFVRAQRKKLVGFEQTLLAESDTVKRNLVIVEFERFVGTLSVREAWHNFCGFSREKISNNFDPAVSVQNVGVGRKLAGNVHDAILEGVEARRRELFNRLRELPGTRVL